MTTLERLKAWLDDEANISLRVHIDHPSMTDNGFLDMVKRRAFVTSNGVAISIQQGATHYCRPGTVEMWCCPHLRMLADYGGGEDPYANVPIEIVAQYIDAIEGGEHEKATTEKEG